MKRVLVSFSWSHLGTGFELATGSSLLDKYVLDALPRNEQINTAADSNGQILWRAKISGNIFIFKNSRISRDAFFCLTLARWLNMKHAFTGLGLFLLKSFHPLHFFFPNYVHFVRPTRNNRNSFNKKLQVSAILQSPLVPFIKPTHVQKKGKTNGFYLYWIQALV